MEYEQLKEEVRQIADIAGSVPEQFRDRCFELLLSNLIGRQGHAGESSVFPVVQEVKNPDPLGEDPQPNALSGGSSTSTIPMTTQLRVLMRKTVVTSGEIDKILMYESKDGGEVHFIREPHDVAVIVGQMEWALLLALKRVILKDSLSVDPEDVRSVCQEKGFYDTANFAANFKKANYAKLFKGPMLSQGEAQQLSGEGLDALGKLIKRLAGESK